MNAAVLVSVDIDGAEAHARQARNQAQVPRASGPTQNLTPFSGCSAITGQS